MPGLIMGKEYNYGGIGNHGLYWIEYTFMEKLCHCL